MPRLWADWQTGSRNWIGKFSRGLFFQLSELLETTNMNWPGWCFHLMCKNKTYFGKDRWGITPITFKIKSDLVAVILLHHVLVKWDRTVWFTRWRILDTEMSCPVGVSTSLVIVFTSSNRQHQEKKGICFVVVVFKVLIRSMFFASERYWNRAV